MTILEKLDIYKNEYLPYFIDMKTNDILYQQDLGRYFSELGVLFVSKPVKMESFEKFLSRRVAVDPVVGRKVFKDGNWYLFKKI